MSGRFFYNLFTLTRAQVVQELECMVSELRLEYDEQLVELQQQLAGKDLELAALREQLLQVSISACQLVDWVSAMEWTRRDGWDVCVAWKNMWTWLKPALPGVA